jgi:hypothetical protein
MDIAGRARLDEAGGATERADNAPSPPTHYFASELTASTLEFIGASLAPLILLPVEQETSTGGRRHRWPSTLARCRARVTLKEAI